MDTVDTRRRAFLQALTTTTAALALGSCGADTVQPNGGASGGQGPSSANLPPVWQPMSAVSFTQGVAASFSITPFLSDPNSDPLTITKNAVALPAGVTFDAANKRFVYDGIGGLGSASGVVLTADDGRP
jgi:hypothetical protein